MLKSTLKDYQKEGANFTIRRRAVINTAKTGKGKTLITLACVDRIVNGKNTFAVVFAPLKAYDKVWGQEIEKHTDMVYIRLPEALELFEKTGSIDFMKDYDLLLVKYPQVKAETYRFLSMVMPGRVTVYDEVHKLKNPEAQITKLLTNLSRDVAAKWGLTATGIGNNIMDLWGLMQFFDPTVLGTEWQFKRAFCEMEEVVIGWKTMYGRRMPDTRKQIVGYKNLDKLKEVMSDYMWTSPSDIKVKFHEVRYDITDYENDAYIYAAHGVLAEDPKGFAQRMPDIQRVTDGSFDMHAMPRTDFRGSKYIAFLDEIKQKLSKNESVIVFAEFQATFDMLDNLLREDLHGVPIFRVSGAYLEDADKFPCVILSSIAGAESLNLKFCNHVFCFSIPFSVLAYVQLVGRITRMDSVHKEDLNVYVPYCERTIDFYKYEYLKENASLINEVLGRDANLPIDDNKAGEVKIRKLDSMRRDILWRFKERAKTNRQP
jgi:SNF2 family DNA or RNA helicase